jgi:hypothetical protein
MNAVPPGVLARSNMSGIIRGIALPGLGLKSLLHLTRKHEASNGLNGGSCIFGRFFGAKMLCEAIVTVPKDVCE